MPVAIARKLQASTICSFPALASKWCASLSRPNRSAAGRRLAVDAVKKAEKRASRWRDAFGIDQTEIDALTTPASAASCTSILKHAFKPYIDPTLQPASR